MSSATNINVDMDGSLSATNKQQNTNDEKMADGAPQIAGGEDNSEEELVLPPEVWASVMEYLPFNTVLSCGATCRSILHDAMPLVKSICIDKSSQMNLAVASRFRDVKEIHINSFLSVTIEEEGTEDEFRYAHLDLESKIRTVPFLSRFASLEVVHFRWKNEAGGTLMKDFASADCYFGEGHDEYPNEGNRERLLAFLDNFSGAFTCGALPKQLKISGLSCPWLNEGTINCETCLRACKEFPVQSVVEFECRRSSTNNVSSGRMYGLDVCLDRAKIDSIIMSRPGGKELLHSKDRLLRLLGRGRKYRIDVQGTLHFVKYKQEELDEIRRVIRYAELDVKKLSMESVSNAIMNSFATGDRIPSRNRCILSEASLDYLANEIGLPIDRADLETDFMTHIQQFVWVLMQCHESDMNERFCQYTDIEIDCLKVVRRYLEVNTSSVQEVVELIPCLVNSMTNSQEMKLEAAHSLKDIFAKGTDEDRKTIVSEGAVTLFTDMLDSAKDNLVKVGLLSLVEIATKGTSDNVDIIAELGAIPKLIKLLDSKQKDCVNSSLQVLVAAKDHIKVHNHTTLLHHVIRIMNIEDSHQSDRLLHCSELLREILEADKPPIQTIGSGVIPRLIEILATTENDIIRLHLICSVDLFAGTKKHVDMLVKSTGFLPVLVSLVKSQHDTISEKAITVLGKVVSMDETQHQDMLLQAGIVEHLLRVLKESTVDKTLENTSLVLSKCCRGRKLNDFATSKEALMALTKLLMINNEAVVCNSCWALYHILHQMTHDEVNIAMSIGFVKPLLNLLQTPHNVQQPVLKSLHLLSSRGGACVEAISHRNGISRLSKTLSSTNQELATWTISNLISGNREQIQTAIDNNVVPSLAKMLTLEQYEKKSNKAALWTLYQITKAGNASQIKYLITEGCMNKLFDLFSNLECNCATIGIWALKQIIKVGKEQSPSLSSGVEDIETKLQEMMYMNLQCEQNTERIQLLEKKIAWLKFDQQNECVESFSVASELLQEQLRDNDQRLQSIVQKITLTDKKSPLGHVYAKLHKKEKEVEEFLLSQLSKTNTQLIRASTKLEKLRDSAKKVAPNKEWQERLACGDMPTELVAANKELNELATKTYTVEVDGDKMKEVIERLFDSVRVEAKKKKRSKKRKVEELNNEDDDKQASPKKKLGGGSGKRLRLRKLSLDDGK